MNKTILMPIITNLGTDYRCYKIAHTLKEQGTHPLVLCDKTKTPLGARWNDIEIQTLWNTSHLDGFIKTFLGFHFKLAFLLFKTKSQIWIVEDCPPLFITALIGKLRRRQVIYDAHEIFTEVPQVKRSLLRRLFWKSWQHLGISLVDKIVTVSPQFIDYYQNKYPHKKYYLLPNVPLKHSLRRTKTFDPKHIRLIYQGYIRRDSNLHHLLYVLKKSTRYSLTIVGQGDQITSLKEKTKELHLQERVTFCHTVPFEQLPELIKEADIGVNILDPTSLNMDLTLGNKIFDYLHLGLPTLLGRTHAITELLKENPIGVQIKEDSPEALSTALEEIEKNYSTFSDQCLQLRDKFSWEKASSGLLSFIHSNPGR